MLHSREYSGVLVQTHTHAQMHQILSFDHILSSQDHTINYTKSPPASTARSQTWAVIQGPLSNTRTLSHTADLGNLVGTAYGSPVGWPPTIVNESCQGKVTSRR